MHACAGDSDYSDIRTVLSPLLRTDDGNVTFCISWTEEPGYSDASSSPVAVAGLEIAYEDEHLAVVHKPAFITMENTLHTKDSVRTRLETLLAERASSDTGPGARGISLVHRLDWETSGLVVVAKTKAATTCISRQFEQRSVKKVYIADVHGAPPSRRGSVSLPLSPDERRRPRQQVDCARGKHAFTRWHVLDSTKVDGRTRTRLRLEPETGRRHQLRCKLSGVIPCSDLLQPDKLSSLVDDSSVEDSDHASAASAAPLLVTLLSLIRGLRPDLPHRRRKVRSCKGSWPVPQLSTTDTDLGKHRRKTRRHSPRAFYQGAYEPEGIRQIQMAPWPMQGLA